MHTDLHLFELSVWLLSFGQALLSVFIPIILWTIGLSIKEIVIFYVIFNFIDVPLNLLAQRIIQKRGALFAVIVSVFVKIASLIVLFTLHVSWADIILLAFLLAVFDSFYWVGHLYIFARAMHKNNYQRNDISRLQIVRIAGVVVAPIVGAYILLAFDEQTLIFFSAIVMCLSLLPLFKMRHMKFEPEIPAMPMHEFFKDGTERVNYFFTSLAAIREEAENVLWPFFIFFIFHDLKVVASIPTIVSVASLILIYLAGKFSYKKNIYKFVSWGALAVALIWVARILFFANQQFVLISVFAISLLTIFIDIPLEISIFNRTEATEPLAAVTYLNLFRMFSRGVFYTMLLIAVSIFSTGFTIVIIAMLLLFVASLRVPKFLLKS